MSLRNILVILSKGLKVGPKNPFFAFALMAPFLYTLIFQVFLGGIFRQEPVIAAYEKGEKKVVAELRKSDAVRIKEVKSEEGLKKIIKDGKADIGVIFPEDLDEKIKGKEKVTLRAFINGESLAKNRIIAGSLIIDILRDMAPDLPNVGFEQVRLGEERALTLIELFLPLIILVAVLAGAFFLPSAMLIQEKENKTLIALLVSPASMIDILVSFGLFGAVLALIMGIVVLVLNVGITRPLLLLPLGLGSILVAEWGLAAGLFFKDMNSLFANIKILNIFILAPAVFYFFPNWPQWIAKIFPSYYIINPVFRISIFGEGFSEIGWEVLVLAVLTAIFFLPLIFLAKKLQTAT